MPRLHLFALTALVMAAFAGNSLLCRLALRDTGIGAADFTAIRLGSGALVLGALVHTRTRAAPGRGSIVSALALLAYAGCFALAYRELTAAAGALLLFGSVQATMLGYGLAHGERLRGGRGLGFLLALGGLLALLLPGLEAPPLRGALLMLFAGAAWGVYSLRGRTAGDPLRVTAGNFVRAAPLACVWAWWAPREAAVEPAAWAYALASGALASGLGYAAWYRVLPALQAAQAGTVQWSVPALAALGGVVLLDEPLSARLIAAGFAILGGTALILRPERR